MSSSERQRIEKVPGSRRAKLTPAPGSTGEPVAADEDRPIAASSGTDVPGPNDQQLRQDVPPHY